MNLLPSIIRTAPMAACAKVQFELIAEIQRQRAQLAKWEIEAEFRNLQSKIESMQKSEKINKLNNDYNSRTIKLALERHRRK